LPWRNWQRSEDYYSEGQLVWLDVDTLIRDQSRGQRSLDDFARAFFGINDGSHIRVTYTFDDVANALARVQAYDWTKFLRARLEGHGPGAPLDGIGRGGYKLVYTDAPSQYFKDSEARRKVMDLSYSLGMVISSEGNLTDVLWEGLGYRNGLTIGTHIVAVDGTTYSGELLKEAVKEANKGSQP